MNFSTINDLETFSNKSDLNNHSNTTTNEQIENNNLPNTFVFDSILLTTLSLTILLALGCIILIVIRRPFRRNKLNWFTINVCATTILLSVVMVSLTVNHYSSPKNSIPCRLQAFLTIMSACQMMYSHCVITISRYFTIIHPSKGIYRSTTFICICLAFGWIIAFLLSIPYLIVDSFTCFNSVQSNFSSYYSLVIVLVIPVHLVLFCNIRILIFVRQSTRRIQNESSRIDPSQSRDVRVLKTMIITFVVFVVGWIPLSIEQILRGIIQISSTVSAIFQMFPSFSMLFDVLLLVYTNQPIRLLFYQWIIGLRHRHERVKPIGLKLSNYP